MSHKAKHNKSHVALVKDDWRIVKQSDKHYAILWRNQVVYVGTTGTQAGGMLKALNK